MKTADLIKKKEEEKNNPLQETTTTPMPTAPKPVEGMNMAEARMAGNGGVSEMETTTPVTQTANTTTNPVSLYEIGKQAGNINQAENVLAGKSPITTPEYEKFRNEVIGAQQFGVETEEQKKKRERADFIKQGLTGLTEGLSSLANLYYTTKWAPNQKMTSQMPALQKQLYQERLERDKKLENFRAWQRDKARRDEDRAYQDKIFNINRNDRLAREAAEAKQRQENFKVQFDYKVERDKVADQRYKDETEYKRGQDEIANKNRAAQLAEQKRHNQAMEGRYSTSSTSSSSRSGGKGKSDMRVIDTPNGVMDVDFNRINENTYNQLYNKVPDNIKEMFKVENHDEKDVRDYKMNAAISYALQFEKGYSDWLEKAGVGVYQQQPEQNVQPDKGQQASGNKWDAFDTGKTDFSKQKRPTGQANTAAAEGLNAPVQSVETTPKVEQPTETPSVAEELTSESPNGNKYEQMVNEFKKEEADEREAKRIRIEKAMKKRAKTVEEAKAKRAELNSMLNNEYAEMDVEKFIKDNNISFWNAPKIRMLYADDQKDRASIIREIERLDRIINNR